MLYNDFINLISNSIGIGMSDFIPYLTSAYKVVVDRIRIDPLLIPVEINKATVIDRFNNVCIMTGSNSEIAFKSIKEFPRTKLINGVSYQSETNQCIVGNRSIDINFGLTSSFYDDIEILTNGTEYTLNYEEDKEVARVLLLGYMYPYFIRTLNGYELEEHRYDLQWMIDNYLAENLIIDDCLLYMVTLKAVGEYYLDNGGISLSTNYEGLCSDLLNIYNKNIETLQFDTITAVSGKV